MNILLSKINGSAKIIKEKVANIIRKPNVLKGFKWQMGKIGNLTLTV